ncbi:hypothetical protein CVD28_00775 [Bacillus sp. M6-12]|uniref:GTP-binding protein n=1 Tax=Bacillus sp. M6-12 TaxID=2054166 RepID=UPI000C78EF30|nr:GTP-binding protein [Bacillus sp. M6-12]PLS18967.1 hypothetical protein CVD28_00775 [Bacillus sp. M6-12]
MKEKFKSRVCETCKQTHQHIVCPHCHKNVNVGSMGHVEHGKTTLTEAIRIVLNKRNGES